MDTDLNNVVCYIYANKILTQHDQNNHVVNMCAVKPVIWEGRERKEHLRQTLLLYEYGMMMIWTK